MSDYDTDVLGEPLHLTKPQHREPGIYILRGKDGGAPFYVGATRDLSKRMRAHALDTGFAARAGVPWTAVEVVLLPLPKATPALLSIIEIGLIAGMGREADGSGPLLNRDGGGGGGHAVPAHELTARALKAHQTRNRSAAAKKAVETRRRNAAAKGTP